VLEAYSLRDDGIHEGIERRKTEERQHLLLVLSGGANVAIGK
jgi:hypothetical protein